MEPDEEEGADDEDRRDERSSDTRQQCHRESTHRSGAVLVEHGGGERGGHFGVDDRAHGVTESFVDRGPDSLSERKLLDRKSTRLNSSHLVISYAVFCLNKKK